MHKALCGGHFRAWLCICDHTVLRILMILGVGVLYGKSSSVILEDRLNVTRTLLKGVNGFISVLSLLDRCGSIRYRKSLGVREKLWIAWNSVHWKTVKGVNEFVWNFNICSNPGRQVTPVTKFCTLAPNICVSSVRNVLQSPFWRLWFGGLAFFFLIYEFLPYDHSLKWPQCSVL